MEEMTDVSPVMVVVPDCERLQFVAMVLDVGAHVMSQVKEPGKTTWVVDVATGGVPLPLRGRKLRPEWFDTYVKLTPIENAP